MAAITEQIELGQLLEDHTEIEIEATDTATHGRNGQGNIFTFEN